jgi:hypothetical protein
MMFDKHAYLCDRLVDELSIWLNERVNEEKEKKTCIVHYSTLWNTHTQKFNLGCDRWMLTATIFANKYIWTNARAHIMYKLIERARKKSVCSRDCIASGWPWSKREEEEKKRERFILYHRSFYSCVQGHQTYLHLHMLLNNSNIL